MLIVLVTADAYYNVVQHYDVVDETFYHFVWLNSINQNENVTTTYLSLYLFQKMKLKLCFQFIIIIHIFNTKHKPDSYSITWKIFTKFTMKFSGILVSWL